MTHTNESPGFPGRFKERIGRLTEQDWEQVRDFAWRFGYREDLPDWDELQASCSAGRLEH